MNREQYGLVQQEARSVADTYASDIGFAEEMHRLASQNVLSLYKNTQDSLFLLFQNYSIAVKSCSFDFDMANAYFSRIESSLGSHDTSHEGIQGQLEELFEKSAQELYPKMMKGLANYFLTLIRGSITYLPKLSGEELQSLPLPTRKYADLISLSDMLRAVPVQYDLGNAVW